MTTTITMYKESPYKESPVEEQSALSKLDAAYKEIERLTRELQEANRQIVYVNDEDTFSVRLGNVLIHEGGLAAHVKAMLVTSNHWQRTALIRELLESKMGLTERDDKTCLNMAWIWEE